VKRFIRKKIAMLVLASLAGLSVFAMDIQVKILPFMYIPMGISLDNSVGMTAGVDVAPITVRERDSIFFTAQGTYGLMQANGISNFNFLDISLGAGYEFRIMDRLSIIGEASVGFWNIPKNDKNNLPSGRGYSLGARATANFYIFPFLQAGAFAGYRFFGSDEPFMGSLELGASVRLNLTKTFSRKSDLKMTDMEISPLFPVFYSHYDDNSFGTITFVNNEKNKITDVEVSIFIEEYMSTESVIKTFDEINAGESFTVDLTAFLNESILNTIMEHQTNAKVFVRYRNIGLKSTHTETVQLVTLNRNNMSWEEDERAATFVSGKDASASRFARFVQLIMKDRLTQSESVNIQYARGIFAALKAYGINYVVDPSSAFTDNVGTASIDFLQFPYQTLLYHGGDCDDLTILNCSLLEALGIDTALITVPGHIYMAFDSGYTTEETGKISDGTYILYEDKVWIPVEITMCQDTFQQARKMGMIEWNKYGDQSVIIPVREAWEKYNPVSIPDSDVNFELPDRTKVLNNLK